MAPYITPVSHSPGVLPMLYKILAPLSSDRIIILFQIYLGSDTTKVLIGTYCGELPTFVINSTANRMAIHFVSDQMINSVGFTIRYTYIYGILFI